MGYESSHLRGRVSIGHFDRGSVDIFEGCSEVLMYLLFSILYRYIDLVYEVF